MTVILRSNAPKDSCKVDLTPRRLQKFATPRGRTFRYTVTDLQKDEVLASGSATADEFDLLTLKQIPLVKGKNRVKIVPAKKLAGQRLKFLGSSAGTQRRAVGPVVRGCWSPAPSRRGSKKCRAILL